MKLLKIKIVQGDPVDNFECHQTHAYQIICTQTPRKQFRDHPIESTNDYVTHMPNETRKVHEVDFSLHNPKKPNQCARTDNCVAVCWQAGTSTSTVLRFYLFDPSTWYSTIHLSDLTTKSNAPQSIISVNVMTDHFPTSADWDHKAYSMRSKDGTFGVHPWFPRWGHWAIFLINKGQRVRLAFHSTWPEQWERGVLDLLSLVPSLSHELMTFVTAWRYLRLYRLTGFKY